MRYKTMNDYVQVLRTKVQKEYDDFIDGLMNSTNKDVIDHAYEKVIKEDLLICILNENLDKEKAKALSAKPYPLDYCYIEWLKNDCSNKEFLQDTVNGAMQKAMKEKQKDERESR
ncbi:DUF3848 domain-containing protein [Faecalicoccus pleomorphus]|nr:DUF3848 domain-containing protein [Faecalicoccus pleomorphus]